MTTDCKKLDPIFYCSSWVVKGLPVFLTDRQVRCFCLAARRSWSVLCQGRVPAWSQAHEESAGGLTPEDEAGGASNPGRG